MASRTKFHHLVNCLKHGRESDTWAGKQVKVNPPRNKRDRREGGCPFCKQERIEAEKAALDAQT